ncbi:2-oxoglutarate dehydrogenase complex dihydrolipoyllysine-residue succinyltransferase [Hymenobacter arcticus]
MPTEIKIPAVGESITEVTIAKWLKKDGEAVKRDEVIAELESDKATFELPAEADGVLKIRVAEGETINIGTVIAELDGAGGSAAPAPASAPAAAAPAATTDPLNKGEENAQASDQAGYGGTPADRPDADPSTPGAALAAPSAPAASAPAAGGSSSVEMKIPAVGESITEVTVAKWLKPDGAQVACDEVIAELESDKATFELPAEAEGILRHAVQEGETISIGAVIARIESGSGAAAAAPVASAPAAAAATPALAQPASANASTYATGVPSPAAGKILDEKGIKAADVAGTGRDGRITKDDAQNAQAKPAAPAPAPAAAAPANQPAAAPAPAGERGQRRERMSNLRKTVARRLVSVKNETAMLTTFNEVNMQPIMDLRNKFKDKFKEKKGVGLGFMSFFTKAVCVALQEWPAVNAYIDGGDIVYSDFCDISIAVSAPKGLVVPVIRNAEKLSFEGVEKEVVRLAGLARDNKLTIEQMTGGTFTITNGGIFGSMMSTPIINAPQSAILGMHNIIQRPVAENGQVVIRPMMYLALSYDHRVIDGRESVSFLVRVKELLEDPTRLLLGV